ncbi:hypothetical protein J2S43_005981 [Catenuloplanes nepalensis]|uniref:Uncharacterized protein n=1 Tax=Catenuloplanes nepalensis TaxID=587533 RepID=A0ABT9N191_9ACTN|nr:hypothetical protein [Catenuloplanes nepalensis]MDP9797469.1 hypothetical protein [Catenuloplanes nepalensis]
MSSQRKWRHRRRESMRVRVHDESVDDSWVMVDGRRFFVAGFTSSGVPFGVFEDEIGQMEEVFRDLIRTELRRAAVCHSRCRSVV